MIKKPKDLSTIVAENLLRLRTHLKMSQPHLTHIAWQAGYRVAQTTISRIERGHMVPTVDLLQAIAAGLNIEPWQLLVEDLNPEQPPVLRESTEDEKKLAARFREALRKLGA